VGWRLQWIGYLAVAASVALFSAWEILLGARLSSLAFALLCPAAVLALLGMLMLAFGNRLNLVFALCFCVSLAGVIAVGSFDAPNWLGGVAIATMLVAWGGFLFAEPFVVAARRLVEPGRKVSAPRSPSRFRLGELLHQVFLIVAFAAIVAATLGHPSASDALFAASFGVVLVSALLRLPAGRRGLIRGVAWIAGTAAAVILIYVRSRASDAVIAIGVVVAAAVALREARRRDRR
jgi:hypothetical protein